MHTGAGQSRATAEQNDRASTNTMAGPRTLLPVRLSAVILLAPLHHAAKRFRGEADLGLFTLVRRMQAGIAGKVSQQTAAADAQADAEADGWPPARPVDAVRGHLGQHGRRVVFRVQ